MLENTPIGAFITLLNEMIHWFKLNEIPNSFSLVVEVAIGVGIALYLFYLQTKTSKANDELLNKIHVVISKIDSVIAAKKQLEEDTKRQYITIIVNHLQEIKKIYERAIKIIEDFYESETSEKYPSKDVHWLKYDICEIKDTRISDIQDALRQLERSFTDPNTRLQILTYLQYLGDTLDFLPTDRDWNDSRALIEDTGKSIMNTKIKDIDLSLKLLANEQ